MALGGTSYAGVVLGPNVVKSINIKNGQVKKKDLAKNSVRSGKIRDGAVKEPDLKDGAITSTKLSSGAVTAEKVGEGAITPSKVGTTPAARAYHSVGQSIPSGAGFTALALDSERYDTTGIHDPVTNNSRMTAASAGLYLVGVHVTWTAAAAGAREINIRKNGATILARVVQLGDPVNTVDQELTTLVNLAAGDYVEAVVRQTSGAAVSVVAAAEYSPELWATWTGPA